MSNIFRPWNNWINNSVGAIMFFNQRSALLQLISSVNYVNYDDNNPVAAAKAFANQKQFWTDYSMIFNSDMLKQRRTGRAFDVNANELFKRLSKTKKRPLLYKKDLKVTINKIYLERRKTYSEANFRIKCDFLKPQVIVNKVLKLYEKSRD